MRLLWFNTMGHISMVTFPGQRLLLFLSLLIPLTISQRPIAAKWSTSTIGPDGPWQAVEAALGDGSTISLYPGNIYSSWVITTEYCNLNRSSDGCFASVAGTYNKAQGEQLGTGSNGHINFSPDIQGFSPGLNVQGPKAEQWVDNMDVGMLVPNVSMALFEDQMLAYPSGQWYPAFAGCLGLGGNGQTKQVFTINDLSSVNASLIPGALWKSNEIPSNSFGLHIGSVTSNTPGSLWWGGYDQSRITGDVLFSDISKKDSEADFNTILRDISIEVVDGSSPFDFQGQSQKGLLSSDSKASLSVLVNGCSPYLSLPKSTCDRITEYLPVRYDSDLGLYLWNTQSPSYQRIVSSASALAFTLQSESAENSEVTIRVPFAHLNLTLNKPLAEEPTPYFPCFTGAPADSYVLGRAFMQDAFLGANWGAQAWWLAQAPGPNFARSSSATPIREDDATIKGGSEDWKATWDGIWRVLSDGDVDGSRDGNSENRTQSTSTEPAQATNSPSSELPRDEGLSSGATAGIAVGASVVGLALVGGLWLLWARRRKASTQPQESSAHQTQIIQTQYGRSELEGEGHGDEPGYSKYRYMRKPFADTVTGIHGGELYGRPNDGETQAQNSRYELP